MIIFKLRLYHAVMVKAFSITAISNRTRSCNAASERSDTTINLLGGFSAEFF
jgi:hypothetical protein